MLAWGAVAVGIATPWSGTGSAPAAGGVGALMAGARRARARRSPHAGARRGHLGPPDVGLLRALRHARRRPGRAARAAEGRPIRSAATACSASARCPTTRLQRALGREDHVGPLDTRYRRCTGAGSSPARDARRTCCSATASKFPRSAVLMAACFDLGCIVYWLVPTAPPWYAGANGQLPPVRRIMAEAGERFWGRLWHPLYHSLQGNPFAAMPSLHFGTSVMAARSCRRSGGSRGAGLDLRTDARLRPRVPR